MLLLRNLLILICLLSLAACGFTPIYAKNQPMQLETAELLEAITVEAPRGRRGQLFKAELEDQLNPSASPTQPAYKLIANIGTSAEPMVIQSDGTASRYRIIIRSPFSLIRLSDNQVISKGSVRRSVSYNVSEDDDYATYIAQTEAYERGYAELAQDYKMRISAIMAERLKKANRL